MARALKDNLPGFWTIPGFNQDMVSPDELDSYSQYEVSNPSISTSLIGTISGTLTANTGTSVTLLSKRMDYPRNFQLTVTGGTVGGTVTVSGQDQFGVSVTETIGLGTAATGGSAVGSTILFNIGTVTLTPATANTGTYAIGVQAGTSATIGTAKFGLPARLGGSADIKSVNYINNGTVNILPSGTGAPSTLAGTQFSSFSGTSAVAITDVYQVLFKPTRPTFGTTKTTGLGTT